MNDKDLEFGSNTNGDNVYRATTNFNTALENPEVNINTVTGVNIQDLENQSFNIDNNIQNFNNNMDSIQNSNTVQNAEANLNQYVNVNQNFDNSQGIYSFSNNNILPNNDVNAVSVVANNSDIVEEKENEHVLYQPTMKQKKKPGTGLQIAKEVKAMMVIILILLLVVIVIPYIYDFFKEMDLVITS